jgi:hypothetical protein
MQINTIPGLKSIKLPTGDKHCLIGLALEAEIAKKRADLARIVWQQAAAVSEAAGDSVSAKLRVPQEAQDVTIDLNKGIIQYRMPGALLSDEVE